MIESHKLHLNCVSENSELFSERRHRRFKNSDSRSNEGGFLQVRNQPEHAELGRPN